MIVFQSSKEIFLNKVYFLVIAIILLGCHKTIKLNLKGVQLRCDSWSVDTFHRNIRVIKDGKIIKDKVVTYFGQFEVVDLDAGKYIIEFGNIHGQTVKQEFNLKKDSLNRILLCVDEYIKK